MDKERHVYADTRCIAGAFCSSLLASDRTVDRTEVGKLHIIKDKATQDSARHKWLPQSSATRSAVGTRPAARFFVEFTKGCSGVRCFKDAPN